MTPEGKVKEKIKKILKQYDCVWWMPAATYGRSGVSDFNVLYKGTFIAIEAKSDTGKLTKLQEKYLNSVQNCGGVSMVADGENAPHYVKQIMDSITWPEGEDAI